MRENGSKLSEAGMMTRCGWFFGLTLAAAVGLWAFQIETQQGASRGWEYAVVENWSSSGSNGGKPVIEGDHFRREYRGLVVICYLLESGCRTEQVELSSSYLEEKNGGGPNHFGDAQQAAVAKAVALLGSGGWELVGSGPALVWMTDINQPAAPIAPALYFKRLKRAAAR